MMINSAVGKELQTQRARLRIVADEIECVGTLDMSTTWHPATFGPFDVPDTPCGTPGCIAGYAAIESVRDDDGNLPEEIDDPTIQAAQAWLMLTDREASDLFMPETPCVYWKAEPGDPRHITPAMAVDTLRRFAETGRVVWREAPTIGGNVDAH